MDDIKCKSAFKTELKDSQIMVKEMIWNKYYVTDGN